MWTGITTQHHTLHQHDERKRIKAGTKTSWKKIWKEEKQQREIKGRTLEREHQLETKQLTL